MKHKILHFWTFIILMTVTLSNLTYGLWWRQHWIKVSVDEMVESYLDDRWKNLDRWMSFMAILSTIFATFFVYSFLQIRKDMNYVNDLVEQKVKEIKQIATSKTEDVMIDAYLVKIFSLQANQRFEEALDFLNKKLESPEIDWNKSLEYSLYKEKANTYWLWWEWLEAKNHDYDNQDKFLNAQTFMEEAISRIKKAEDEEILNQYKDRYNSFIS